MSLNGEPVTLRISQLPIRLGSLRNSQPSCRFLRKPNTTS